VHVGDANELHPFRDGNGCTQRALFGQLAADAGWGLAWERMEPPRNLAASRAAHHAQAGTRGSGLCRGHCIRTRPAAFLGSGECVRPGPPAGDRGGGA